MNLQKYQHGGYRVLKHLLFWLVYISSYALAYGSYADDYGQQFVIQLMHLPERVLTTYLVIYWALPNYLKSEKQVQWIVVFMGLLVFGGFLHWLSYLFVESQVFSYGPLDLSVLYSLKVFKGVLYIYPVVFIAVAIKLFQFFYENQKKTQWLAREKLQAELKFLKAQIHPHFLFNTLNNLYALSLKKSPKAPEMVLKLSALLDYMLYECNAPKVPLKKELDLLDHFLELERLRYGNRLQVEYQIKGTVDNQSIIPLVLLPFVENAFKHGASGLTEEAWVKIVIDIKDNKFTLMVQNSKTQNGVMDQHGYTEGIGIQNVKRRLELQYPNQHLLEIADSKDLYQVTLELILTNTNEVFDNR